MNDLLNVILDFSVETLVNTNPIKLLQVLVLFLNAYQLHSSKNVFKVYAAFPGYAYLMYPITEEEE